MLRFLLDTDHVTLYQHGHPQVTQRLSTEPHGTVGISVVTLEETLRGRLAVVSGSTGLKRIRAYAHLLASWQLLQPFPIAPYDQTCEDEFQKLRSLRLRIGSQDLRIAAPALANKLTAVTRNRVDFGQVPNLMIEDWSV